MAFSTINQVIEIAKSVASQTSNRKYGRSVFVESNNYQTGYTCEYGDASAVITYCPYATTTAFQSIIILWILYFVLFMAYRIYVTSCYYTCDLRFYIAVDKANGHLYNKIFVAFGAILTIASLAVGLYYMSPQTSWNDTVDTYSLVSLLVFLGINFLALHRFSQQYIKTHNGIHKEINDCTMIAFTKPIFIQSKGVMMSVDRVIQLILVSYMLYLHRPEDDAILRQHGNPGELIEAMQNLYK